ncbi:MAG: hypothetical protein E6J41_08325 [Chloroflexi bacterium]|nr:MAG: hypothetical protein E6J41_08325 [Chloroflexota bacterium]
MTLLMVALAVQASRWLPASVRFRPEVVTALGAATIAAAGIAALAVVLALAGIGATTRLPDWREESASEEEPLLPQPAAPRTRGRAPLVAFADLESSAGASSLAFNLAVLVAVQGQVPTDEDGGTRRPRPLCLLSEGQLSEALGLESDPWRLNLDQHTGRIGEDLVDLTVRHPSGCELLCVPRGRVARHQLRLLRQAVDRHYDLVVVDSSAIDRDLREGAEDTADALIAVGLVSPRSAEAAAGLVESGRPSRLATTVLLINQMRAADFLPDELPNFQHVAMLPYEHVVPEADRRGLPWSLMSDSECGRVLRDLAAHLLPEAFTVTGDVSALPG